MEKTRELVKKAISGTRKGLNTPTYIHSFRVSDLLKRYWFSNDVVLAWLLHDMIEDSDYTREDLKKLWYSDRVLDLVCLCSHDKTNLDKFWRREDMIRKLKAKRDTDARAIKLADITDNLAECHLLKPDALERFLTKKAPVFVYYGNLYFWGTKFYNNFLDIYHHQFCKFYGYDL